MKHSVPIAIVIAGIFVAAAVFWVEKQPIAPRAPVAAAPEVRVPMIQAGDHVRGNPNASIVIVEYSDTECPFCKAFHTTLKKIIDTYGKTGQVAWVFRNFPIAEVHSKAPREAQALECAAEQGGEPAFWKYVDRIYEVTPADDKLDPTQLAVIASDTGLDVTRFSSCVESNKYKAKIDKTIQEAKDAGATGTPFNIIMYGTEEYVLQGAETYEYLKGLMELLVTTGTTSVPGL